MLRKRKIRVGRNLTETTLMMQGKGAEVPCACTGLISKALLGSLWNSALLKGRLMAGSFCSVSCRPGLSFVTAAAGCQTARRLYISPMVWHPVFLAFPAFDTVVPLKLAKGCD